MSENEPGKRLRDFLSISADGRRLNHWSSENREADVAKLADTIAACGNLYNRAGSLALLTEDGTLVDLLRNAFQAFITQHVTYRKLVHRDGKWREEYFSYQFNQRPHFNPTAERPNPPRFDEPDIDVLNELMGEVVKRVPRAV